MPYFEAQLSELTVHTTDFREPPWILEFRLIKPRVGIDEEARFRNIDRVPKNWPDHKTVENWIIREDVEMDNLIEVKLRRRSTGAATKIYQVVTDMLSQKWSGESPIRWYTIRDMLDAAGRLSGVKEQLRKKHPPDLVGTYKLEPTPKEKEEKLKIPLFTLEKWFNDEPNMHREFEEYEEYVKEEGEQAGKLKIHAKRAVEQ